MNKINDYNEIWKLANADLEKYGMQIELQKDDCDAYAVIIRCKDGKTDYFAEGYYEDELGEVINDAWVHAKAKAKAPKPRKGVKVTKRATNDGLSYSLSGLTFSQLFRIKSAMAEEEKRMNEIANNFVREKSLAWAREFKEYARDAHEVFIAACDGCV